ncbi:hypothetical protein ACC772_38000, partial [Rhizobium ruizarguesonis]
MSIDVVGNELFLLWREGRRWQLYEDLIENEDFNLALRLFLLPKPLESGEPVLDIGQHLSTRLLDTFTIRF